MIPRKCPRKKPFQHTVGGSVIAHCLCLALIEANPSFLNYLLLLRIPPPYTFWPSTVPDLTSRNILEYNTSWNSFRLLLVILQKSSLIGMKYSMAFINKRPVLLNVLVWIFPKSFYQTSRFISEKLIVLFNLKATMTNFWSLLSDVVWIFEKNLYQMTSTIYFSNSRSQERFCLLNRP